MEMQLFYGKRSQFVHGKEAEVANVSVGRMFLAGVIPGLLAGLMLMTAIYIIARRRNLPAEEWKGFGELMNGGKEAGWGLFLIIIIIGGIYGGIFSPTEAAAACVLYALFLEMIVFRELSVKQLYATAKSTGLITAVVFILVGAGAAFSYVISFAQIPQQVLESIGINEMGAYGVLFTISIAFFIGCMFVDPIVVILVFVPIFAPVVIELGFDPIWFAVVLTINMEIGLISPPVGMNVFVINSMARDIGLFKIFRGVLPFMFADILRLILLAAFPAISLFLPNSMP